MGTRIRLCMALTLYCILSWQGSTAGTNIVDSLSAEFDSIALSLDTTKDDSAKVKLLNRLAWVYEYKDPVKAKEFTNVALELGRRIEYREGMVTSLLSFGHLSADQGEFDKAIKEYQVSLDLAVEINYIRGIASCYMSIGLIHDEQQGNYPLALDYYFKALKMYQQIGVKDNMAICYNNIGTIYHSSGDPQLSMKYHYKSLEIKKSLGNEVGMGNSYSNIGGLHKDMGEYAQALDLYLQALEIYKRNEDEFITATVYMNIGALYYYQDMLDKALKFQEQSLEISEKYEDIFGITMSCNWIGWVKFRQGDFSKAEEYLKRAEELAVEIGHVGNMRHIYEALSALYDTTARFELSLNYYKLFAKMKDSLFNEGKSKEIGKLEAKHEFETAEAERKREVEERLQEEHVTKARRDNLQYSGILIFMVLVFAGVFMLGRIKIPIRLAEGMIFFSFLLFFEFTLVLLDPYIEDYSSGAPAIKLGFNALLAALIFPLHSLFEAKLKGRIIRQP